VHQKLAAGPFGTAVKADMDVVVFEPPKALAFQVITGPLKPRVKFRFAPVGAGTEVSFCIEAPLSGLKKSVMGRMAEKTWQARPPLWTTPSASSSPSLEQRATRRLGE
jgi:hypothetical protein